MRRLRGTAAQPPWMAGGLSGALSFGFSLVELLVAMAVLALMLVLLFQLLNSTLQSTHLVNRQMDAVRNARLALDVIAADFQNSVVGNGAYVLYRGSNSALALLTRGRGPSSSTNGRFLAVDYSTDSGELHRSYLAVPWTSANFMDETIQAAGAPSVVLSRGVLAYSIVAVLEDGSSVALSQSLSTNVLVSGTIDGRTIPAGWMAFRPMGYQSATRLTGTTARARSLQITIAAIDEQNERLLKEIGKLASVTNQLVSPGDNESASDKWTEAIDALENVPAPAKSSIRVLSKTVNLQ